MPKLRRQNGLKDKSKEDLEIFAKQVQNENPITVTINGEQRTFKNTKEYRAYKVSRGELQTKPIRSISGRRKSYKRSR